MRFDNFYRIKYIPGQGLLMDQGRGGGYERYKNNPG